MFNRRTPKTDTEIENLIKQQLNKAGFSEDGQPLEDDSNPDFQQKVDVKPQKTNPNIKKEPELEKIPSQEESPSLRPKKTKVIDDRHIRLEELPSNFYPYPGRKYLMIRPFTVRELKLIARSIEHNNIDFITQAIDNCIDMDVYDLTIQDYYYLYYWFRIESYPNTPYFMEWICDEEIVDENGVTKICGNENVSQLTKNSLKVVHLDDLGFKPEMLDPRLDFPRVKLLEDLTVANEDKKKYEKESNSPKTFTLDDLIIIDAAKWLKEGETIFDKMKILDESPNLELYEIASKTNKALQYGVYEYTLVNCGGCGAKRRYRVSLDAPHFFPFAD